KASSTGSSTASGWTAWARRAGWTTARWPRHARRRASRRPYEIELTVFLLGVQDALRLLEVGTFGAGVAGRQAETGLHRVEEASLLVVVGVEVDAVPDAVADPVEAVIQ